jgi:hypothetical protein
MGRKSKIGLGILLNEQKETGNKVPFAATLVEEVNL